MTYLNICAHAYAESNGSIIKADEVIYARRAAHYSPESEFRQ